MEPIYIDLESMDKTILQLGFAGENEHTRIVFECDTMFAEYPNAIPALSVQPPKGSYYPAVVTRNGNNVIWDVIDSCLIMPGTGEVQLSFIQDGVIAKSYCCKTNIKKSIIPNGDPPDPIRDFVEEAGEIVAGIPEKVNEALQTAKDSHEFDGQDGVSPTVTVSPISGGHSVIITDAEGNHEFSVLNGQNGVSPDITVTDIPGGHRITIVDVSGTNTFDIPDGDPATIIATAQDVGKALSPKTVIDGKVTEWQFVEIN